MKSLIEAYVKMKSGVEDTAKLKGDQHKLDKNKNGKLDSDDFKKLRKEEQDPPFAGPYTTVKNNKNNGAQKARALAQKALKTAIIQGHEKYTSSPDKLKPKNFGMAEQFTEEELDYMINEVLSKDAKAGDWISDFVHSDNPKFAGKSKAKRKEMALAAYYSKQRNEEVELDEGYEEIKVHSKEGKHIGTITHGKYQSVAHAHPTTKFGGSKEPHPDEDSTILAGPHETQKGIDFIHSHHRMMSEEVDQIDELSKDALKKYIPASAKDLSKKGISAGIDAKSGKAGTTKDYGDHFQKRYTGILRATRKLAKEEVDLQEANHREFASQGKMHPDMAKNMVVGRESDYYEPKTGDKVSGKVIHNNGKEVHVKQTADSYDPKKVGTLHKFKISSVLHSSMKEEQMKTYSDLISQLDEYNSKEGVYRHKGKYGTSHDDPGVKSSPFWHNTEKDEDDKPKKAEAPVVKRGRGRPAGAKSGARQFGAAAKDGSGADYTGMKLHLPNSNR